MAHPYSGVYSTAALNAALDRIAQLEATLRQAIDGHKVWESVYGSSPTSRAHLAFLEAAIAPETEPESGTPRGEAGDRAGPLVSPHSAKETTPRCTCEAPPGMLHLDTCHSKYPGCYPAETEAESHPTALEAAFAKEPERSIVNEATLRVAAAEPRCTTCGLPIGDSYPECNNTFHASAGNRSAKQ